MSKKPNLESGFLILADWVPLLENLPGIEVKKLLLALMNYQRNGVPMPLFRNALTAAYAAVILPTVDRRLEGKRHAAKAQASDT